MHPKMISVVSSNIAGVQYVRNTLLIAFRSGKTYAYESVPKDVFDGMVLARSKGTYLNEVVKTAGFAFRPVDDAELDAILRNVPSRAPRQRAEPRKKLNIQDLVKKYSFLRHAF